ncbi:glutathione S-transferase N-terminal domain-containing protein [Magnetovibrio sp. PR-2]|uniref:glutathione S-transferase family protein n=1 Tax=Magnetovibrio sp. PR-2 TaxID=3120356 RepID=UPI002FCE52CA
MMDFYMTPGSCSTGIHILLEELDLLFSAHVLSLPAGDQNTPEYLAVNPKGTIPALVLDDGTVLSEFQAIAWWLALAHPKAGLLPEDITKQAEVLEVMSYAVSTIHMQGFTRIFTTERYISREQDRAVVEAQGRQLIAKGFNIVAQKLEQSPSGYVTDAFSIADAALFYVEFWATRTDIKLPDACQKHFDKMCTRPVVQRVLMEEGYRLS